ncbi:MAG: methylated-DNA--[protein]-cysteine S-methyltransferase [Bacteroidia bacterium]
MIQKIYTQTLKTPYGELLAGDFQGSLCLLDWKYRKMRATLDKKIALGLQSTYEEKSTPLLENLKEQLSDYFTEKLQTFDIPLLMVGTDFQKAVWNALLKIPYGQTKSYLTLSRELGNEKAIRAVASANGANTISIIIPCHRIIGSNREMVGYAGGVLAKKKLLELESNSQYKQATLF